MRILLLLSALLTAVVGQGAGVRLSAAQTHQAIALAGAEASQTAEAAQSRRPVQDAPRPVLIASQPERWVLTPATPLYAERLRV